MKLLICCISALFILNSCAMNTPSMTTKEFVMAMAQGDRDKALSYMHIPDGDDSEENAIFVKEVVLPPLMRKVNSMALANGGAKNVIVEEIKRDEQHAIVLYTIIFANGERTEKTLSLQKTSNWRVVR